MTEPTTCMDKYRERKMAKEEKLHKLVLAVAETAANLLSVSVHFHELKGGLEITTADYADEVAMSTRQAAKDAVALGRHEYERLVVKFGKQFQELVDLTKPKGKE